MTLLEELNKLDKQYSRQEQEILARLILAYGEGFYRIKNDIALLEEFITSTLETGRTAKASIQQSITYRTLMVSIKGELDDFEGYLKNEIRTAANAAGKLGLSAGNRLMIAALADELGIPIENVPRELISRAPQGTLDFLQIYIERLTPRIDLLSDYHTDRIGNIILDAVAYGWNPKKIAKAISTGYGVALTDSLRMMRTVQLYGYRQAQNASQIANSDILDGVVWHANLDGLTCMSCVALHGKVFPVGTLCNDHYNGRCRMLPLVKGAENPLAQSGEAWFREQAEGRQKNMMGAGQWEAWKAGRFDFSALSIERDDDVYGRMRTHASLKELIGEDNGQSGIGGD